jgi:hypothetical protein
VVTLTHPEKSDNLDDVLLKDFMKKRDIWGDQWIIPEERDDSGETTPTEGLATESD